MAGKATTKITLKDNEGEEVYSATKTMSNEQIAKYWGLCPYTIEGRRRRVNWYQRWCKYPAEHQQILGAMFGALAWELRPQFVGGVPAQKAHPWLKQLYNDLNEFALISPEFDDIKERINGNYTKLFDEKHEDETRQFILLDVKIIRRAYHTVKIPPPSSLTGKRRRTKRG